MCYFGVNSGGFGSLMPLPLVVHVRHLPPPHSEGKRKVVVLLSEHGMPALGKSEELSGLLGGAAWIPIAWKRHSDTSLTYGHQPSET